MVRRHLHNNMVQALLTEPLIAHMVGMVGLDKPNVHTIWGDFSAIKGIRHKNNAVWIAKVNDPVLMGFWQSMRKKGKGSADAVPLTQFWAVGERYCLASVTGDCRRLRIHKKQNPFRTHRGAHIATYV